MKIGCCNVPYDKWNCLADVGYDYIEGWFGDIAAMPQEAFARVIKTQRACGLEVEVCNSFFKGDFVLYAYDKTTGEASPAFADVLTCIRSYIEIGFERAASLGTRIVVIGSGGARRVPADMKPQTAQAQLQAILSLCADVAARYGITVTVEPLNTSETNTVNTLSDSLALIKRVGHPHLKAMTDFYHMGLEKEPLSVLKTAGDTLVHAHVCRPDRGCLSVADKAVTDPMVNALRDMGYTGRLSLECRFDGELDTALKQAYALLRHYRG